MKKKRIYQTVIAAALLLVVFGILVITKKVRITPLLAGKYEINGVDVSHYQGAIDWPVLAGQELDFAFIKATEGSGHVDECFYDNWQAAAETDLLIGSYHFFSFDSAGKTQAQFYIDTVGSLNGKLAPAVDVEFYGDKRNDPPPKEEVVKELRELLAALEEHYRVKPVIYTTYQAYHRYIKDEFTDYPLWIRNVYYEPLLINDPAWTFWQYTDTEVLEGYQGTETYIDRNVFCGTKDELRGLTVLCGEEETSAGEEDFAEESKWKEPDSFSVWNENGEKKDIPLEHCNLEYDTERVRVYSYGIYSDESPYLLHLLFLLTPEGETVYPVKNFWVDQEREAVWLLEQEEALQVRKIDLSPEHFLEESVVLDRDGLETLLAYTYGIFKQAGQEDFGGLHVNLFCQKEEGKPFLGGQFSGIAKETGREFEIVYEIDRESGAVSARGYLQDLAIAPLFQEFLLHNLTVENPLGQDSELGESLGFFDDENYLREAGAFCKQFAVVENSVNGKQELLFRMRQTEGRAEWIYVLEEEQDRLVCKDILQPDSLDKPEDQKAAQAYRLNEVRWLDCASFFEIPTENCKEYLSRDEVFSAVEAGDFSVVVSKPFDPEGLVRELEMAYGGGNRGSRRTARRDIDGDGSPELLLLRKYDFEEWERIEFILDYRNGRAVCVYMDWCDGMEWLLLGKDDKLIHCSCSNNTYCMYYGFQECTLNARGIKEIDYTGNGAEACNVYQYEKEGNGLWWWEGQELEITQGGVYFTRTNIENTAEGSEIQKALISREEFIEAFTELTGEEQVWNEISFF